jgi:serine/threonine protein kinase
MVIADRYVLKRKLGEGGMGVVWIARSKALDVDVALKMLRGALAGTDAVERMAREARAAAQLGHPAMVRVLDFGETDHGEPFLAMELLRGDELYSLLEREGRLSAVRAVGLLLPIIDGLATAHDKGIVHRDIKPENVFIARDEQGRVQPKLLDFGIAKLGRGETTSRLTRFGAVLGSPQYLSPEQAEGVDDVDFRTDIWSIGVLLYELVTGEPPFSGNNYNALIMSILRDVPKPITDHNAGNAQLWTTLARCLQKDPAERWSSMWELGEALALWLFEQGVRVDASSRSLRDGWLDGSITGVRIIVSSVHPPAGASTLPPPASATLESERARSHTDANTLPVPREKADSKRGILGAVAIVALVGLGLFLGRRGLSVPVRAAFSARSAVALPERKEPSPAPVPSSMPSQGTDEAANPVASAPPPTVAPEVSRKAPATSLENAPAAAASSVTKTTPASDRPRRRPRKTVDTEFGF